MPEGVLNARGIEPKRGSKQKKWEEKMNSPPISEITSVRPANNTGTESV
jgi:hypothetical protein